VTSFLKTFLHNLHPYRRIGSSYDSGYAARSVNYANNAYVIATSDQFHQTFFSKIYATIGIFPEVMTQVMPLGA
jgi:hypothetical protein